ncbi:nucleotide disphospho-sugar-binding domain-containing protein [Streptomyces rimosus]|uniref:nucleotide disphospho-sugar-binding domain-containing protein n=1 Tax=Streptomyces rimosus TaxID=1927 RepID=UPI00131B8E81|nr:nucleotide disphospho-sugar-binding domain-containing protein [Streptomyces rimosus]
MFVVSDYGGHYSSMVPLGWALQAAGHEVRLVCGPAHTTVAEFTGLPVESNGTDVDTFTQARLGVWLAAKSGAPQAPGLPLLDPFTGARLADPGDFDWPAHEARYTAGAAAAARDRARGVVGVARHWRPDLVVYDLFSPEGLLAAELTGVPSLCQLWGPTGTDETGLGDAAPSPDIPREVRERLGIDLKADLLTGVIDPCPAALSPPSRAPRLPMRYVPYNGPGGAADAPPELSARPRICLIWSHSLTKVFGPASFVVPDVVRACADLDVELVLALNEGDAAALGPVPATVRVLRNFPAHVLLPTCSAVVHHGGSGCLMTAMAVGVPQLALPLGPVLESMAERLAGTGSGLVLPGSTATVESIGSALVSLLNEPSHAEAARTLAEENAARPAPSRLVPDLVRLAETREVRPSAFVTQT